MAWKGSTVLRGRRPRRRTIAAAAMGTAPQMLLLLPVRFSAAAFGYGMLREAVTIFFLAREEECGWEEDSRASCESCEKRNLHAAHIPIFYNHKRERRWSRGGLAGGAF